MVVREFKRKSLGNLFLFKMIIYNCAVILACINLGNSLGSTKNQSPDEERYSFFDAELLRVYSSKENGNFLVSPITVKLVLSMLMEGAEEATAEEIRTVLRLPEEDQGKRKEFAAWLSVLQGKESPNRFRIANRIFSSNKHRINPDYRKILKRYYSSDVTGIAFDNEKEASQIINSWVSNQTSHVLTNIIEEDQINPEDKLILTSAVYFKGLWSTPFASEKSVIRCFYSHKNQCQNARMMMETGYFDYGYISRLDAEAIVMPYQGKKFSMLILLPAKRGGISQLGLDLIHVSLKSILSEVRQEEVFLQIPQFEITYNDDLVESLKKMHVSRVFKRNANLSKIFVNITETTGVSRMYHSAKITVDEDGSEAAAATAALIVPLMGGPTTSFIANHPFMFFLLDSIKNLVIFAGKVVTPKVPEDLRKDTSRIDSTQASEHTDKKENLGALPVSLLKVSRVQSQREQGPTFRSIEPDLIPLRAPPREKTANDDPLSISTYKSFVSRPSAFTEKEQTPKRRLKTAPGTSKKPKRKEEQNDDWRHHVLFFT